VADLGFVTLQDGKLTIELFDPAILSDPHPTDFVAVGETLNIHEHKHHIVMNNLTLDGDLLIEDSGEVGII